MEGNEVLTDCIKEDVSYESDTDMLFDAVLHEPLAVIHRSVVDQCKIENDTSCTLQASLNNPTRSVLTHINVEENIVDLRASVLDEEETVAILKIESIFQNIADALSNDSTEVFVLLKRRPTIVLSTTVQQATAGLPDRKICFPGRTAQEAWRFSQINPTTAHRRE